MVDNIIDSSLELLSDINYIIIPYYNFYNRSEFEIFNNKFVIYKTGTIFINSKEVYSEKSIDLQIKLLKIHNNTNKYVCTIQKNIKYLFNLDIDYNELISRIEEFEVFKNGEIDNISADSLYDFYKSK